MPKAAGAVREGVSTTDRHWRRWGKLDPYFGVLGHESNSKAMSDPAVRERFFAQGEAHIAQVMDDLRRLASAPRGRALDFGCGVGRLLGPLAARFDEVVGVDVSPDMLRLAAENTSGWTNVQLAETIEDAVARAGPFDLVHTYIVIQHIGRRQGLAIIGRLLAATRPGGAFAIHFTVGDSSRRRALLNAFRYRLPPLQWANNLARGRSWNLPVSEMNAYPVGPIMTMVRATGAEPVLARSFDQGGHHGLMLMGFRPAAAGAEEVDIPGAASLRSRGVVEERPRR